MSNIAEGVSKKLIVKKETVWGQAATPGFVDGVDYVPDMYMRRRSSDLSLSKDSYSSQEIRDDHQTVTLRHGMRRVEGTLQGELAPGSYFQLIEAALRKDFDNGPTISSANISAVANGFEGENFKAAGFKPGHVIRAFNFAATVNNRRNILVTEVTTNGIYGECLDGGALTPEAAGVATSNIQVFMAGRSTYVPTSGHTDDSFTFEHWYEDVGQSEVFTGVKVNSIEINLPPTGIAEASFNLIGKDMVAGETRHFPNPDPSWDTNALAAVNGRVYAMGSRMTLLTGLSISINGNLSTEPVVGSNTAPKIFRGRVGVSGQMTAYFEDGALRDEFINEGEVALFAVFTTSDAPDADFIAFRLPRVKLNGASKDDGEKGLIQTIPFVALKAEGDTTIEIQDTVT